MSRHVSRHHGSDHSAGQRAIVAMCGNDAALLTLSWAQESGVPSSRCLGHRRSTPRWKPTMPRPRSPSLMRRHQTIEELAREGARRMLERALAVEVDEFLGRPRYERRMLAEHGYRRTATWVTPPTLVSRATARTAAWFGMRTAACGCSRAEPGHRGPARTAHRSVPTCADSGAANRAGPWPRTTASEDER